MSIEYWTTPRPIPREELRRQVVQQLQDRSRAAGNVAFTERQPAGCVDPLEILKRRRLKGLNAQVDQVDTNLSNLLQRINDSEAHERQRAGADWSDVVQAFQTVDIELPSELGPMTLDEIITDPTNEPFKTISLDDNLLSLDGTNIRLSGNNEGINPLFLQLVAALDAGELVHVDTQELTRDLAGNYDLLHRIFFGLNNWNIGTSLIQTATNTVEPPSLTKEDVLEELNKYRDSESN